MGRTGELARAALDAAGDVLLLGALPVLESRELGQQVRLQSHGTDTHALCTADARLGLLATGLIVRDNRHRVRSLADRHLS